MKNPNLILIIALSLIVCNSVMAQLPWIVPGNNATTIATDFVGTRDLMSLGFRTNNFERMQIFEPAIPAFNTGFVGIGDYTVFNPAANVHAHDSPNDDFISLKVSTVNTGFTRDDGFTFGIDGGLTNTARIIQHESFPIEIFTHNLLTRMLIDFESNTAVGISPVPLTRIAIPENGVDFHPLSILHLGLPPTNIFGFILGGYRNWMDIGTLSSGGSEHMYVGLIEADTTNNTQLWNDYMDAVINWGDNVGPIDGANNLRFIFTSINGPFGTASNYRGLEVARFTPIGRFGVGNFASVMEGNGSGILPYRKLEIYDEGLDALLNASAPQLRLTFAPGQTVSNGIWTDFQTTSTGNLFINPSTSTSGTPVNGFVGINISTPSNTLEINSNSTYTFGVIGNSGLTFSDLRSGSGTSAGNGKVLTVDNNGVVILVPDNDGGSITACSVPGLTTNYITKATASTQICRSQIYDDGITVGIGVGSSVTTAFRFQVGGDFLLQPNSGTNTGDIYMRDASTNRRVFAMYGSGGNSTLAVGPSAGGTSTSSVGINNVYVGPSAGLSSTDETRNTFIGARSGEDYAATSADGYNTFVGTLSGGDFINGI